MPNITIVTGALLIVLGLVGFVGTGSEHYTALIPAFAGILLAGCGVLARNPARLKLAMHIAVTLALLGFLGTIPGVVKVIKLASGETVARPEAAEAQAAMAVITGIFVALCVNSFIKARKKA